MPIIYKYDRDKNYRDQDAGMKEILMDVILIMDTLIFMMRSGC